MRLSDISLCSIPFLSTGIVGARGQLLRRNFGAPGGRDFSPEREPLGQTQRGAQRSQAFFEQPSAPLTAVSRAEMIFPTPNIGQRC